MNRNAFMASGQQSRAADHKFINSVRINELKSQITLIEKSNSPFQKQKIRELRKQINRFSK